MTMMMTTPDNLRASLKHHRHYHNLTVSGFPAALNASNQSIHQSINHHYRHHYQVVVVVLFQRTHGITICDYLFYYFYFRGLTWHLQSQISVHKWPQRCALPLHKPAAAPTGQRWKASGASPRPARTVQGKPARPSTSCGCR